MGDVKSADSFEPNSLNSFITLLALSQTIRKAG